MSQSSEIYFLGNPGVGKSTLLNGFVGSVVFKSGFYNEGVTTSFEKYVDHRTGITYCDTPGLDEPSKQEQAAREIVDALRDNIEKERRLVFVVTLEGGRVRNADLVTMRAILDAMHAKAAFGDGTAPAYGVIINKALLKTKRRILSDENGLLTSIRKSLATTEMEETGIPADRIFINLRDDDLENEDNVLHDPPLELKRFVSSLPPVRIDSVDDITTDKLNELNEQVESLEAANLAIWEEIERQQLEFAIKESIIEREREEARRREEEKRQAELRVETKRRTAQLAAEHSSYFEEMRREISMRLRMEKEHSRQIRRAMGSAQGYEKVNITLGQGHVYRGQVRDQNLNGYGLIRFSQGGQYEGMFKDGDYHGYGVWRKDGHRFEGMFEDDERCGVGIYTWPDGSRHEGDFIGSDCHGSGVRISKNGDKYAGEWFYDQRSGHGVEILGSDGRTFSGQWSNNKMVNGVVTWPDGSRFQGELSYEDGKGYNMENGTHTEADGTTHDPSLRKEIMDMLIGLGAIHDLFS